MTLRGDTTVAKKEPPRTARIEVRKYPTHPPKKTDITGCVPASKIVDTCDRSPHSAKKIIKNT